MNHIDSAHNLIYDHFNYETKKFVHPDQKDMDAADEEEQKRIKEGPIKHFEVPDSALDDWTGSRFAENWKCYGNTPCEAMKKDD